MDGFCWDDDPDEAFLSRRLDLSVGTRGPERRRKQRFLREVEEEVTSIPDDSRSSKRR